MKHDLRKSERTSQEEFPRIAALRLSHPWLFTLSTVRCLYSSKTPLLTPNAGSLSIKRFYSSSTPLPLYISQTRRISPASAFNPNTIFCPWCPIGVSFCCYSPWSSTQKVWALARHDIAVVCIDGWPIALLVLDFEKRYQATFKSRGDETGVRRGEGWGLPASRPTDMIRVLMTALIIRMLDFRSLYTKDVLDPAQVSRRS